MMHLSSLVRMGDNDQIQVSAVALACRLLLEGNIIALPTDTIYGLAACAQDIAAVRRLYEVKGRDSGKPLAICVGQVEDVCTWAKTDSLPDGLLSSLLPGPVTVVLERTSNLNLELNPSFQKVGIRIPDHPFIRQITQKINSPIALTSANFSNEPSSLSPKEFESLWPQLAAVFDGGRLGALQSSSSRAGSTIVDLSEKGKYFIVRSGCALPQTLKTVHQFGLRSPCRIEGDASNL